MKQQLKEAARNQPDEGRHEFRLQWQDFRPTQDGEQGDVADIEEGQEEEVLFNQNRDAIEDDELEGLLSELCDVNDVDGLPQNNNNNNDHDNNSEQRGFNLDDDDLDILADDNDSPGFQHRPSQNKEIETRRKQLQQNLGDVEEEFLVDL